MRIRVELNNASIKQAQKELKYLSNNIKLIVKVYCRESLIMISNKANEILDSSTHGYNTSDIRESGALEPLFYQDKFVSYRLINKAQESLWAEFGTGIVGASDKHANADNANYQYADYSWTFVNPLAGLVIQNFEGYVGHEFLYKAMNWYMTSGMYKSKWEEVVRRYI